MYLRSGFRALASFTSSHTKPSPEMTHSILGTFCLLWYLLVSCNFFWLVANLALILPIKPILSQLNLSSSWYPFIFLKISPHDFLEASVWQVTICPHTPSAVFHGQISFLLIFFLNFEIRHAVKSYKTTRRISTCHSFSFSNGNILHNHSACINTKKLTLVQYKSLNYTLYLDFTSFCH